MTLRTILVWYFWTRFVNYSLERNTHMKTAYPVQNLFHSKVWEERVQTLGLGAPVFYEMPMKWLKAACFTSGLWSDFERWPTKPLIDEVAQAGLRNCDWIVVRKLLPEQTTSTETAELARKHSLLSRPVVLPYSSSPFLDLTKPLNPQKEKISHVYRTERKLTREFGKPELVEYVTLEERQLWFTKFCEYQSVIGRLPERQRAILERWVLEGEKPEWMKLFGLVANGVVLTCGLFYFWDGVFYYYSSAMNPDPQFRKYGPGKMLVEKLIQYAIANGATTFDFLQGDHPYKSHWNPETRTLYQWISPVSIKGGLALQAMRIKQKLKPHGNTEH